MGLCYSSELPVKVVNDGVQRRTNAGITSTITNGAVKSNVNSRERRRSTRGDINYDYYTIHALIAVAGASSDDDSDEAYAGHSSPFDHHGGGGMGAD
ncbi:hypothetical protein FRX31_009779 [Thalictrum thalictroides]|uniref:Uncharacterized protein n=1 Tax=Thalictrum thalictroides TaxID=46969 RepID=A0A7J6WTA4_THATH|nr:hypothetical protein FRX31_009779 [Thalictrum thalictroides]